MRPAPPVGPGPVARRRLRQRPPTRLGSRGSVWRRCRDAMLRRPAPLGCRCQCRRRRGQGRPRVCVSARYPRRRGCCRRRTRLARWRRCSRWWRCWRCRKGWPPDRRQPGIAPDHASRRGQSDRGSRLGSTCPCRGGRRRQWGGCGAHRCPRVPARPATASTRVGRSRW